MTILTEDQKQQLIKAFLSKGYNYTDAVNKANGPEAKRFFDEYCGNKIDNFFANWLNHGIDQDGAYGNQCMDLMHQYIMEVVGLDKKVLAAVNAKTVFNNFINMQGHDRFTRIINKWWLVPQKGDIVFWGNGVSGHVAIFQKGTIWSLTSFDQNWPTQGYYDKRGNFIGTGVCHFQNHNYNYCLGWLRPMGLK